MCFIACYYPFDIPCRLYDVEQNYVNVALFILKKLPVAFWSVCPIWIKVVSVSELTKYFTKWLELQHPVIQFSPSHFTKWDLKHSGLKTVTHFDAKKTFSIVKSLLFVSFATIIHLVSHKSCMMLKKSTKNFTRVKSIQLQLATVGYLFDYNVISWLWDRQVFCVFLGGSG